MRVLDQAGEAGPGCKVSRGSGKPIGAPGVGMGGRRHQPSGHPEASRKRDSRGTCPCPCQCTQERCGWLRSLTRPPSPSEVPGRSRQDRCHHWAGECGQRPLRGDSWDLGVFLSWFPGGEHLGCLGLGTRVKESRASGNGAAEPEDWTVVTVTAQVRGRPSETPMSLTCQGA